MYLVNGTSPFCNVSEVGIEEGEVEWLHRDLLVKIFFGISSRHTEYESDCQGWLMNGDPAM